MPIALVRIRYLLLAMMAVALVAADDPPRPVWQGVWQGSVGTLPVRMCLVRRSEGDSFGSYYYLARLRTIRLEQQGKSREWTEGWDSSSGPPAPRWRFATIGSDRLSGTWSDGRRTLAFRLARMTSEGDESPCGTESFNAPRWRPLGVTRSAGTKDGVAYTKLTYHPGPAFPELAMAGFALNGDDAATRRINADLRAQVPGKDEDWKGCITGGLDAHGADGDFQSSVTPDMITPRWLAATLDESDDCGGAHPNSNSTPLTYDRTTGAAVKLETWLNDAAMDRSAADKDTPPTVRPAFRRAILARSGDIDQECREAFGDADFWDVGLDRRGLNLTPELSHAEQACADAVLMPWTALAPFLSPAGRAGMASLARTPR